MVTVGTRPPQPRTITAAASQKRIDPKRPPERAGATDAKELYNLYRNLGPVRYGLNFKAGAAKKVQ